MKRFTPFLSSPAYIWLLAALTAAANFFSLELPVYTLFAAIGIAISLWGRDYLGLMPIVIFCYIVPSAANNPGGSRDSIFFWEKGGWYLAVLGAAFALSVTVRIFRNPGPFFRKSRKLLPGIGLLGAAYALSGLGYGDYKSLALQNLTFAAIQLAAVGAGYFFFCGAVSWKKAPRDYFCHLGLAVGTVVLGELLALYAGGQVIQNGQIHWAKLTTGWGIHNNIGVLLAMMIPFPFYFARTGGWKYHLWAGTFLAGVCLTCSRSSILFGGLCYAVCLGWTLAQSPRPGKVVLCYGMTAAVLGVLLWQPALGLFQKLLEKGFHASNRDVLYAEGLKQFAKYPLLGGSFYAIDYPMIEWSTVGDFSKVFPPRWHNTWVQLAASCGLAGLGSYLFHRIQTVRLFLRRRSRENWTLALSLGVLLGGSLLDCHFFNVGPVLFYSMALAWAENSPQV